MLVILWVNDGILPVRVGEATPSSWFGEDETRLASCGLSILRQTPGRGASGSDAQPSRSSLRWPRRVVGWGEDSRPCYPLTLHERDARGSQSHGRRHVSYLLRLWQAESESRVIWRASIQSPDTGERRGFAALADLLGFLEE